MSIPNKKNILKLDPGGKCRILAKEDAGVSSFAYLIKIL